MGKNRWLFTTLTRGLRRYRAKDEPEVEEVQEVAEPTTEEAVLEPVPVVKPKPIVSVFSDTAFVIQEGKPIYMPSLRTIKKYKADFTGYLKNVSHNNRVVARRLDWIAHNIVVDIYGLAGHKGQLLSTRSIAMFENVQRYIERTGELNKPLVMDIDGRKYTYD